MGIGCPRLEVGTCEASLSERTHNDSIVELLRTHPCCHCEPLRKLGAGSVKQTPMLNENITVWVATKAFIEHESKILVVRESSKYKDGTNVGSYDVVGGRIEPGQRFDESLLREIKEETGLNVTIGRPFFVSEWRPKVRGKQWQIVGTFFVAHAVSSNVMLSADHDTYKWIDPRDYKNGGLIENLYPAFEAYLELESAWPSNRTSLETIALSVGAV